MHLLLADYLKESFHSTAYAINVYVQPGPNALRLSRLRQEQVKAGQGPRISVIFSKIEKKRQRKKRQRDDTSSGSEVVMPKPKGKKRMREVGSENEDNDVDDMYEDDDFIVPDDIEDEEEVDS